MPKQKNPVWRFFASVKLALAILIILATTSIIGTIIKQGQSPDFYVTEYGQSAAQLLDTLQLTHMYSSWWYISFLALFAINLLVCSIERLPSVWRIMTQDNLLCQPQNLEKMSCSHRQVSKASLADATEQVSEALAQCNWRNVRKQADGETMLLFVQKGAWSRLGVYVVHLSILIILVGAIVGSLYGFQAYVYLPEGRTTEHIYKRYTEEPYPMGFGLRCDRFEKTYYASGMVKQYRSDLTVIDPEKKAPYQKSIIVNDPLSYKGLTFYQGDSFPTQEFFVEIINRSNGMRQAFRIAPEKEIDWPEAQLTLQIEKLNLDQDGNASQGRIMLRAGSSAETEAVWIADKNSRKVSFAGQNLDIYFRQFHSTLLLISKDPGVSTVFAGCTIMMIGLAVCLCFAHRRIWVKITPHDKGQSLILVGGVSNKNKFGFEQGFRKLGKEIDQQTTS